MTVRIAQPHVRHGDPHVTSDDPSRLSIHACLYEALVRRAPGGRFRPGLAESWQLSDDARTWRFDLRDARFHDGKALSAVDAVASLRRVRDEDIRGELGTSGVFRAYLEGADIDTEGSGVRITTPEPFADLLDLLVDIPVIRDGRVGTGPYRLYDSTDEHVQLVRYAHRDLARVVEFRAIANADERAQADVDIATDVPVGALNEVRAPTTVCTTFLCNLAEGPCASTPFRRALNYATDVQRLITEVMGGAAVPIRGPWTERHLGHDPGVDGFGFDADRARVLLGASGQDPSITLDVPSRLPDEARTLAEHLTGMWSHIGIETTTIVHDHRPAYADMVRDKRIHDAACFDSSPSSTFRLLWEKFHSGNRGPWWQGYENPTLDALIDRARATADTDDRAALYRSAFGLLHDDAPWVFLYNPARVFAVSDRLEGWQPSPDGYAILH